MDVSSYDPVLSVITFQEIPLSVEYFNLLFSSVILGNELYKSIYNNAASYFFFGSNPIVVG